MENINRITKIIKILFFFAVTLLIFYLIFRKVDYLSLKEVFLNAKWYYLVLAILVILLAPVFSAKKWQTILKSMDYHISFRDSFKIIMAAFPTSAVTPAKVGDLIRAHYLKDKVPVTQTMGAVVTERFIDIFVLASYSFAGAAFLKNELIMGISLFIIFLTPLSFLVINKIKLPPGKWQQRIENFLHVSKIFISRPQKLLPVLFFTVIFWSVNIFEAKILFLALGVDVPLFYVAAAFPLAIFIGLLPITMAGMGTRDSAIIYLFSPFGSASASLGAGLLYSLFAYWFLALLGLPIMKKLLWKKMKTNYPFRDSNSPGQSSEEK